MTLTETQRHAARRPLRIGTLGTAKITPKALIHPARDQPAVEVVAVAARDRERAEAFAGAHDIPRVYTDYDELVRAPDIDAVYNPLPTAMHAAWTIQALRAGKHVLSEKPFASNAAEAIEMVRVAGETGLVLTEAFHYRYHPLMARVLKLLEERVIGEIERVEACFCAPIDESNAVRYSYALSGGATMDLGCYPIHLLRHVMGSEPEVVRAQAQIGPEHIDVAMEATLRFQGGIEGKVACAMGRNAKWTVEFRAKGERGMLAVQNYLAPHYGHLIQIERDGETMTETVERTATYQHQLEAFVAAVQSGQQTITGGEDAVCNMRVIDEVYRKAGLRLRGAAIGEMP